MELQLFKKPKNVRILQGFPGMGLIGTISTEYLMEHLKFEQIGRIVFDDAPAIVAIHMGKIIEPLGVYYSKEANLVIVHGINAIYGNEWHLSDAILEMCEKLSASEIISIEGVGAPEEEVEIDVPDGSVFYYSNNTAIDSRMKGLKIDKLQDGIIMGITSALITKTKGIPMVCFFAKTHSKLPDSKAAAEIIKALDKYIGLKVDYHPLIRRAEEFECKLRQILSKSKEANELHDAKRLDYFG